MCSLSNFQTVFADESPCLGCHDQFKKPGKSVHPALGMGCETCHQAVSGKSHPDEKGSMKLSQDVPGLCFGCHEQSKFNGKTVHSPVAGGMCTSCHNPHQSGSDKLLMSDQPDLCYNCHDKAMFTKKVVHAAVMMGCTTCHNPHAGDFQKLLQKPVNALCQTCHAEMASGQHIMGQIAGAGGFHPVKGRRDPSTPGKELSCISCHNPHSSDSEKLFVVPDLCTKCHTKF